MTWLPENTRSVCSDGSEEPFAMPPIVENVWADALRGKSRANVGRLQKRYPTTPDGMNAFLRTLFPRHFLQVQASLAGFVSGQFMKTHCGAPEVNIIDIGCGPAVASLAITDQISKCFQHTGSGRSVAVNYILNDTSGICLDTGETLIKRYFQRQRMVMRSHPVPTRLGKVLRIQEAFPKSMQQLRNICEKGFRYDFLAVGYLLAPLEEHLDLSRAANCLMSLRQYVSNSGGITLILQDRFHSDLAGKLAILLGAPAQKALSRQLVYSQEDSRANATYVYYRSLATQ